MLVSSDLSWCLGGAEGADEVLTYETGLNDLLGRYPDVTIVCNYDSARLGGEITLGSLCSHPPAHLPDRFARGYYRPANP